MRMRESRALILTLSMQPRALADFRDAVRRVTAADAAHLADEALHEATAEEVERRTANLRVPISIAVMGCAVNGPGEAAGADFGIAGGDGEGLIYADGKILRKVKEEDMVAELMREILNRTGTDNK